MINLHWNGEKGQWYSDITRGGVRVRRLLGPTKRVALDIVSKMRTDFLYQHNGLKPKKEKGPIAFDQFADIFYRDWCLLLKRKKSAWRDAISLNRLKAHFGRTPVHEIGLEDVIGYRAQRTKSVSDATANREIACLKTLFKLAEKYGRVDKSPICGLKPVREKGREKFLSFRQALAVIENSDADVRPAITLLLLTGMREGEALALEWKDVDFDKAKIFLGDTKSGDSRTVPMSDELFECLGALPRNGSQVFPIHKTKLITGFKRAAAASGLEGYRVHDLRHTAPSLMVELGVDLVTVKKILGHKRIETTMKYVHTTDELSHKAVNKLAWGIFGRRRRRHNHAIASIISL